MEGANGGERKRSQHGTRKCSSNLGEVDVSLRDSSQVDGLHTRRADNLDPKDSSSSWIEKLKDMAADREQWRSYCHFLLNLGDCCSYRYTAYCVLVTTAFFATLVDPLFMRLAVCNPRRKQQSEDLSLPVYAE